MLVACMMLAMFAACGEETETKAETKKETTAESSKETTKETTGESDTEKEESKKETEKETLKETEKETVKETVKETPKETEPETERETKNVTYTTVIDGFKATEWETVFDPTDNNKTGSNPGGTVYQNVVIHDDTNSVTATNKTPFELNYTGEKVDLSEGFIFKVTFDVSNTDSSRNSTDTYYFGNSHFIQIGNVVFQIKEAFNEYFNGAAPVIYRIYTDAQFKDDYLYDHQVDGGMLAYVMTTSGEHDPTPDAEYYSEAWGHHNEISEDVVHYMNTTFVLKYDGYALTVAICDGEEVIDEWELWNGSTADEVIIDPSNFVSSTVRIYKTWGGYHDGEDHAYVSGVSLLQAVPVE